METSVAVATAITFVWLGMVLGISFLETPLKFRAPGVTIPIGLGIGRLVFRALNTVEAVLAVVLVVALIVGGSASTAAVAGGVAVLLLLAQLALVRPRLTKRSDRVLAGQDAPRSHAHLAFVGLESAKVVALLVAGVALLAG
ncbi:hypothetical protein MU582_07500 [Nocardioidaceae bacterium SCSIO 66511]|nr:hypothetical protein MU582_07500 [Nocardioidaceae bacterium SCSIO 66511]